MRLQSPVIVFKPTVTLRPTKEEMSDQLNNRILPSGVAGSVNLLEPLKSDPAVQETKPKLSAARLSRFSNLANDPATIDRAVKADATTAFRALPAISSRVRYARANGRAGKPSIIASLDIETAPFSNEVVELTAIDMELSDGSSENLSGSLMPILPLKCRSKDNPIFLFRLTPYEAPSDSPCQTSARTVLITVHANVLVSPSCQPKIQMRWKTGVDFSTALNPSYGAPGQSMQRQRRPSSLSRAHSNANLSNTSSMKRKPESTIGDGKSRQRAVSVSDFGVSITVTAPKPVVVGQPFSWSILVLNRSKQPRHFALMVTPTANKGAISNQVSKSASLQTADLKAMDIADAVVDENSLYALQKTADVDTGEVMCLGTDVRTGYVFALI